MAEPKRAGLAKAGPVALVLAAAAAVQAAALRAPFFADDWLFLDQVRARDAWHALTSRDPIGNYFRPLGRVIWFGLLGAASGESPAVFHGANLLLWIAAVALVWRIGRRLAGDRAGLIAAAVFALAYAADVPVLWASGAQDLLALGLALGGVLAAQAGRLPLAGLLLFAAPFAKETALVACVPALLLARAPRESWGSAVRRAWPVAAAALGWAIVAGVVFARRHAPASGLALDPWGPVAALVGVIRVSLGLEWRTGGVPWLPPTLPGAAEAAALALALGAVAWGFGAGAPAAAKPRRGGAGAKDERRAAAPAPPWGVLVAWIVAGAAPVALVAPLWSAYYFLFSLAGVALLAGAWCAGRSRLVALAVVAVAGFASVQARGIEEFATAPSAFSAQSHVNRFYLERGMDVVAGCLADLKRAHPVLPHGSTIYFAGVPAFAALQVGDGPLVRGVYRDTSLRSYYITQLDSTVLHRGPYFLDFWDASSGQLVDRTDEPDLWFNLAIGYLIGGHPDAAATAFAMDESGRPVVRYGRALAAASQGDTVTAAAILRGLGFTVARGPSPFAAEARARLAAGDSLGARGAALRARTQAVLDPVAHRVLAVLLLGHRDSNADGVLEAFAGTALAPDDPASWRLWASVQMSLTHYPEALVSIERYFALDPGAEARDPEAAGWRRELRERQPGGRLAQAALKDDVRGK